MNNRIDVLTDDNQWLSEIENPDIWSKRIFDKALSYLKEHGMDAGFGFERPICINLSLSNDDEVRKLNREFRGLDKPTNVLSFANIDDEMFWQELETADEIELGDIIVALETLKREAAEKNIPLLHHFAHLLIHGILHLFGYDHQTDEEAEKMEHIEVMILRQMGIDDPYEEQCNV